MSSPSESNRFLLTGGWIAIRNASIGSAIVVFFNYVALLIFFPLKERVPIAKYTFLELQSVASAISLSVLVAILFSFFPAFVGGFSLAYFTKYNQPKWLHKVIGKLGLGVAIGIMTGIAINLLVLLSLLIVVGFPQNGFTNASPFIQESIFNACEFILVAAMLGKWTEVEIKKTIESENGNAG